MDASFSLHNMCETDPLCPLDYRWRDAGRVARGEPPRWSDPFDPIVTEAAAFRRALAIPAPSDAEAAADEWPVIKTAYEIFAEDGSLRWELEARLLADQSDEEIAERCEVTAGVVSRYEQLFFAMREARAAHDYLTHYVVGTSIHDGFRDGEVRQFWAWATMAGGPIVLDALVDSLRRARRPDEPATLSIYLREGADVPWELQSYVAAGVIPPSDLNSPMYYLDLWLPMRELARRGVDRAGLERLRTATIQYARDLLSGRRLPRLPKAKLIGLREKTRKPAHSAPPSEKNGKSLAEADAESPSRVGSCPRRDR